MNTYPAIRQSKESTEGRKLGVILDEATNGNAKGRAFYSGVKKTFQLVHYMSAADKTAFDAFEAANLALPFNFTWDADGVTYVCIFDPTKGSAFTPISFGNWKVTLGLVQI